MFSKEACAIKVPVIVNSKKMTYDKILDLTTYEGDVRIEYEDYYILTNKMIITTYKFNDRFKLDSITFPNRTNIVKKDLSETIIVKEAVYDGKTAELKSEGEIFIEKENQLYSAKSILIQLGIAKSWQQLDNMSNSE